MNARILIFLLLLPFGALAQGFAGLGGESEGFSIPSPDHDFVFPRDDGSHPDYRIEWWYLTANMTDDDGRDYGLQWTLFRSALAPTEGAGWSSPQLWMGHAAVTTPDNHYVTERLARGGVGQAGVTADPFTAWIDEWQFSGSDDSAVLRAAGPDFTYDMAMKTNGPRVFHGRDGYSVKSASGQASYYFSQPFFEIIGSLTLPDGPVQVTGQAWLDREWSSQPLAADQTGWDWFSLSFDDGSKLMGFQLRGADTYTQATLIMPDGQTTAFPNGAFQAVAKDWSDVANRRVPTTWQVTLPALGLDATVAAINTQSWMATSVPYWEGPVRISGSHSGRGYLEMTGYE